MYLVQLLLPLRDNGGNAFGRADFDEVRSELTERFGGATLYARAPAVGLWKDGDGEVARDDVLVAEVMADHLDREWWRLYRADLERRFRQEKLVVRALECTLL
jgi:hypothetical protein